MAMVIKDNMTIEELRAEIIKGNQEIETLAKEKDNLSELSKKDKERITHLQEKNQEFFLMLSKAEETEKKEEKPKTDIIDFAKKLKF